MQDDPLPHANARARLAAAGRRQLGDFVLEREIGRGGMGVVWLATQQSIHRRVALKILPSFAGMDPAAVTRFQREAAAAGRLAHPGIVPIHGVGEAEGVHYYAMELIDGPTLSQWIDHLAMRAAVRLKASLVQEVQLADRYPELIEPTGGGAGNRYVRSCARLCADIANALAVAHENGVIHRDLKPSNILIHPSGRPVLVDFGLARDEQAAAGLTLSGDQIGTPAYMAPEQASGRRRIDARVDVYGLGAVLYELLTLRPPYDGATSAEIAHRILTEDPPPVQRRNANVPLDLAAVVHKAMARDVELRYPAIEAFELDLRCFLDGRAVSARLPGSWQRLRARLQRHGRALLIGGGAAAAATAIAFAAGIVNDRGDVMTGEARLASAREQLVEHGEPEQARNLYEQALALTKQPAMVRAQRQRDFKAAFERFYPARAAVLRRFATLLDADDRAALAPLLEQLDGRGTLAFASRVAEQATTALSVRLLPTAADGRPPEDLPAQWREVHIGERLPVGECLVRAERGDGAVAMLWQRVLADQQVEIQPTWFAAAELPADTVACQDPRDNDCFAVACHEVTRAQWRQWLASLDVELRAEMQPRDWDGGVAEPELPVRGLSFQQARAYAALHGGHLPSNREHWLAATAGLRGLTWPWGRRFDAERIAADPFRLSKPQPVGSRASGASPLGVLHLLGNVAEIQSALGAQTLAMAGGHFLDDPRTLRLADESVPTAPLADAFTGDAYAGMRFYRFLERDDGGRGAEQLQQQREQRRTSTQGCVFHDWRIDADGSVHWQMEQDGICPAGSRQLQLELSTPGFLARKDRIAVLDGHGDRLPSELHFDTAGTVLATARLPEVLRQGQGYRLRLQAQLEPLGGLVPEHDLWRLCLPLQRGRRQPAVHSLQLPEGARVIAAAPLPAMAWQQHRLVLTWDQTGSRQDETAVVSFRLDGSLSPQWPVAAEVERLLTTLVPAWNGRTDALADLLDPAFQLLPAGRGRDEVLRDGGLDQLQQLRCIDFARAGDICTAEVAADWQFRDRDGTPLLLPQWHLLLQWRAGPRPSLLRLMPKSEADQGSCRADAGYAHPGMRVRIDNVPDTTLCRTQEQLVALQVTLRPERQGPLSGSLSAQVLGHFADPAESPASIRFRLTAGAATLRQGRLLEGSQRDGWQLQDWLFEDADGSCWREQWRSQGFGRRHLLLRLSARGADADAASAAFAAAASQQWFDAVAAALHVD